MGKSENLPAFCNQKGQRWKEGFGGDNLLLCSQHENTGSEMQVGLVLITEKVLPGRKKGRIICPKQPLGPLPTTGSLKWTCPLPTVVLAPSHTCP